MGSDHYPITIEINVEKYIYDKRNFQFRSTLTNWTDFTNELNTNYSVFLNSEYTQAFGSKKYQIFMNVVGQAIRNHTPIRKKIHPSLHRNPASSWDYECDRAKRLRIAALEKWKLSKEPDDYVELKRRTAAAKKLFKSKKGQISRNFHLVLTLRQVHSTFREHQKS